MSAAMRVLMFVIAIVGLVLAVAFYFEWSWVQDFWPWTESVASASQSASGYGSSYASSTVEVGNLGNLSFYFVSSIIAAVALSVLWIALTRDYAATAGGAIHHILMYGAIAIYLFQDYAASDNNQRLLTAGLLCLFVAMASVGALLWSRRFSFKDQRPTPTPVLIGFAIFVAALWFVGLRLILNQSNVFPWDLAPEVSVVYGWTFLGASMNFVYGLIVRRWHNAAAPLLGFLAYDVVLILPFIRHFENVADEQRLSLIVYTFVVVSSGLLAIYYLFFHPATRVRFQSEVQPEPVAA